MPIPVLAGALSILFAAHASVCKSLDPSGPRRSSVSVSDRGTIRFATFNVSLAGRHAGELRQRLERGDDPQAKAVAAIIREVDPDVLLLNEFDYEPTGQVLDLLVKNYLAADVSSEGGVAEESAYPHRFVAPVNTGLASRFDLDRDCNAATEPGSAQFANDAWGYGRYPGQYGMAVLSRYPLDAQRIRTFQRFLWKNMPGALAPSQASGDAWYEEAAWRRFPLSSKSHWDVPVLIGTDCVHLLASHPTPPVFDGPEDRNGRRNHDEIRFWADYLTPAEAGYIVDDRGQRGGLADDARFIVLGDLNSDPIDGNDPRNSIQQLLQHPRIAGEVMPRSAGGREQAEVQGGANARHRGDPAADTSELVDHPGPGNLRLDYLLPARELRVADCGIFWPVSGHPRFALIGSGEPLVSSDHRLVWLDISFSTE